MNVQTVSYAEIAREMQPGEARLFDGVSWDDYEQVLDEIVDEPIFKITYDNGSLEIMTLSIGHDRRSRQFYDFIVILADELGLEAEGIGSATLKRKRKLKGLEPDEAFYIQNASAVVGLERLDLEIDPPPDLAVEIDLTHGSRSKLPVYAGIGVPEVWRYDGEKVEFYRLIGGHYIEIEASDLFPFLTPEALNEFVEQGNTEGQTAARRDFRAWVEVHKTELP